MFAVRDVVISIDGNVRSHIEATKGKIFFFSSRRRHTRYKVTGVRRVLFRSRGDGRARCRVQGRGRRLRLETPEPGRAPGAGAGGPSDQARSRSPPGVREGVVRGDAVARRDRKSVV